MVLITAAVMEVASCGASRVLQRNHVMYAVPEMSVDDCGYEHYLAARDPVLGWPYPAEVPSKVWDRTGARPSPAFPDPSQRAWLSLYGDSFTQSECSDTEAWGNQLALQLGVRVANYGVGGYGTDQAMLRFQHNEHDTAEVVVLAHMTENIVRNLTRNRDLLTRSRDYAYKPRFVLTASGELQLVAIPHLTLAEHLRFLGAHRPRLDLPHESFHPGGPAGVVEPEFPYTWSVLRSLVGFRVRARLASRPDWAELYEADHPLQGLSVTIAICRAFARLARERGKVAIVLVLPGEPDLHQLRQHGQHGCEPMVAAISERGTPCFDFATTLLDHLGSRDPGELFDDSGHYRPEADALLAAFVHEILQELGLR